MHSGLACACAMNAGYNFIFILITETVSRMVIWSEENVSSQLPVLPGHQLCFTVCIQGDSDFMPPVDTGLSKNYALTLCLH